VNTIFRMMLGLSASGMIAGCSVLSHARPALAAVPAPEPVPVQAVEAPPVVAPEVVAVPVPLPLPGQLKPLPAAVAHREAGDPRARVVAANAAARVQPVRDGFVNAIQQYPFAEGALYQLYAAPGQVTDIALEPGEQLAGTGPVAAGDTARWIIGDTTSGTGGLARVHILVKPVRGDIATNLVINTDRRTYHLELKATPATYMASVSWSYPQDRLIALRQASSAARAAAPIAAGVDVARLSFGYRIDGDNPAWRPLRAFDDGRQVFIEFPHDVGQGELPPLFVLVPNGAGELVNYRFRDRYMVVDRLFAAAELRLGDRKSTKRVRIVRLADRAR
jgi:P-type conjugative transfer protein TrbG